MSSQLIQRQIINIVKSHAPTSTAIGVIESVDEKRKVAVISYVTSGGGHYEHVEAPIGFDPGVKQAWPIPGEQYVIGFQSGNPLYPYLIRKVELENTSAPQTSYEDSLSVEYCDLLDFI